MEAVVEEQKVSPAIFHRCAGHFLIGHSAGLVLGTLFCLRPVYSYAVLTTLIHLFALF